MVELGRPYLQSRLRAVLIVSGESAGRVSTAQIYLSSQRGWTAALIGAGGVVPVWHTGCENIPMSACGDYRSRFRCRVGWAP